ncbi:MAG TPA: hypothetical protein VGL56_10730 [Fimbriimonadaceae bacterium]|jgi:hypothetical protein
MTVRIELPAEIEASLVAQAQAHGMGLPEYVETVLREQVTPLNRAASLTLAERAAAWLEGTRDIPRTRPLSDEAISRESLYQTRG